MPAATATIRFGAFELEPESGELRSADRTLVLQEQPLRILIRLLASPGALVTREDLRREVWSSDTFVDFEHGLNAAVKRLRDALGDSADTPLYIETIPRRGYRFIGPVGAGTAPRRIGRAAVAAVAVAAIVGAILLVATRRGGPPPDRAALVVGDFVNTTGEEVFDATLRQALTIALEQSPLIRIVSPERMRETLLQMRLRGDAAVAGPVARELCQRVGAGTVVEGRISRIGAQYPVTVEAIDCSNGNRVAAEQRQAPGRDAVIDALDSAASALRSRLGGAPAAPRFGTPLRAATTASIEALKAFSVAEEVRRQHGDLQAEPFYRRAIGLDADFAMAYARLASIMFTARRPEEFRLMSAAAVQRRDRVTERERMFIDYQACPLGVGSECSIAVAELWKRTYPLDWEPHQMLCAQDLNAAGDFENALANCADAQRLDPDQSLTLTNLAAANLALNRFAAARYATDEALARHIDTLGIRQTRFNVAVVAGDRAAMDVERRAMAGRPDEAFFLSEDAQAQASLGRMRESRAIRARAARLAADRFDESVDGIESMGELIEVAVGAAGAPLDAMPRAVLARSNLLLASLLQRDPRRAAILLATLRPASNYPIATPARILIAIDGGDRSAAAQLPAPLARDLALTGRFRPVYVRGLAYLRTDDGARAATEFQRILDHRGVDPVSPLYALAHVELARAHTLAGRREQAAAAYDRFLALWKDADRDVPILVEAQRERAALDRP